MISFSIEKVNESEDNLAQFLPLQDSSYRVPLRGVSSHAEYIKSAVYGGLDGIVTTFAVVVAVLGAGLNSNVIVALGLANIVGELCSWEIQLLSTNLDRASSRKNAKL